MCRNLFEMHSKQVLVLLMVVLTVLVAAIECDLTPRNIASHNYPLQEHIVQTSDGYLLSIYRIPAVTRAHTRPVKNNEVVLLQHGFTLSSDVWLLRGPKDDLPYLLADAGYDVWLGNHRGNEYGLKHSHFDAKLDRAHFWNFTWHEMGYYDLPNIVDYILAETGEKSLHYVGYSQGGLVALVLLMTRPEYAGKFKTLQFTAPTVYMRHLNVPVPASWIGQLRNYLSRVLDWWGYGETLQFARWHLHKRMCRAVCADGAWLRPIFKLVYSMFGGPVDANEDYEHILTEICGSVPVGASSKQLMHYMQLYATGDLMQFDYGSADRNIRQYGQVAPPGYNVSSIRNCISIYYSETDKMCGPEDVRQLGRDLQCAELHRLPYAAWNHGDFVWSRNARQALHEPIIAKIDAWHDGMAMKIAN